MKLKDLLTLKPAAQRAKTVYTTDLVRTVGKKQRFSQGTVAEVLAGVLDEIQTSVAQGSTVQLTNFGVFSATLRPPAKVRNIRTNAVMDIPAMYLPRFRPGAAFKQSVRRKKH
jgi:DNA-binding protein HU-beta